MAKSKKKSRIQHADIVHRFAARLRDLREERGLTQHDLARQAQVSPSYIGRLELEESAPGIDTVQRLAEALGCTIHDLLPLTSPADDRPVLREQIQRQIAAVARTEDRQTLLILAQVLARIVETTPR